MQKCCRCGTYMDFKILYSAGIPTILWICPNCKCETLYRVYNSTSTTRVDTNPYVYNTRTILNKK